LGELESSHFVYHPVENATALFPGKRYNPKGQLDATSKIDAKYYKQILETNGS